MDIEGHMEGDQAEYCSTLGILQHAKSSLSPPARFKEAESITHASPRWVVIVEDICPDSGRRAIYEFVVRSWPSKRDREAGAGD